MKLHQLQYLVAIADKGSVRAAAQALNLSPAAVSRGLIELEESLNASLLVRQSIGVSLTDSGKELLAQARLILAQVEEASQKLQGGRLETVTLAVGVTPWIAETVLPFAIERFRAQRTNVRLFLVEVLGKDHAALREGNIDLAIGLSPAPDSAPEFRETKLFSFQSTIVCRKGHELAKSRSISDLSEASWVLTNDVDYFAPPLHEILKSALHDERGPRVHIARAPRIAVAMVAKTDMLTQCPWPWFESGNVRERLDAMHLSELTGVSTVSALTRRNVPTNPLAKDFFRCVMEVTDEAFTNMHPSLKRVFHTVERLTDRRELDSLIE